MSFYRRIKYFLVHTLMLNNKEAQKLIDEGLIEIDGIAVKENCIISNISEIKLNGKIVRPEKKLVYLLFNKPAGFESTLNKTIEKNLSPFFEGFEDLAIAGRLDKASEGLLVLSNNGKWVEKVCHPKFEKEKEYIVTVNKPFDNLFVERFTNGVMIDNYLTKNCTCNRINENTFSVILTEGKNRQIRKMCKVLGFEVIKLIRIRIDNFLLADLQEGSFKFTEI